MNWRENLSTDVRSLLFGPPEERGGDARGSWRGPIYLRKNRHWRDLMLVTDQISAIVYANASLADGFDAATADAPSYPLKRLFAAMANDLDSGMALHESVEWRSRFFPKFYVDMVKSGEETGRLGESIEALRVILRRTWELRTRAAQYAAYIGYVWVTLIVLSIAIPMWIFPSFNDVLRDFREPIPAVMQYAQHYGAVGPIRCVFAFFALLLVWKVGRIIVQESTVASAVVGRLALRLPIARELVSKRNLSLAAFTVAQFLRARVPLHEALESASAMGVNAVYRRALVNVSVRVAAGATFKAALEPERVFPDSFAGFASLGESSGRLPEALERIEHLYRRQVARTERILLDVISPVGILVAGVFVLMIFSSVIMTLAVIADSMSMP